MWCSATLLEQNSQKKLCTLQLSIRLPGSDVGAADGAVLESRHTVPAAAVSSTGEKLQPGPHARLPRSALHSRACSRATAIVTAQPALQMGQSWKRANNACNRGELHR